MDAETEFMGIRGCNCNLGVCRDESFAEFTGLLFPAKITAIMAYDLSFLLLLPPSSSFPLSSSSLSKQETNVTVG